MQLGNWDDPSLSGICGIYEIRCVKNETIYIGCSNQLGTRISTHHKELKIGKHANSNLQADFDQLGEEAFRISILIECPTEERFTYEQAIMQYRAKNGEDLYNNIPGPRLRDTDTTPPKDKLRQILKNDPRLSYQDLANQLGINKTTLWRFVNTNYEPKDKKLRRVLGLQIKSEITYIRQVRNPNGTFGE